MLAIRVRDLTKVFRVAKGQPGISGALQGLFFPNREELRAVDGISFDVSQGESVGYLGPNGAGKSTTIKMLTGILYPTSGTLEILGYSPQKDRRRVVQNLGVVFGQRSQLYWDLRLGESFRLLKYLYRIEEGVYQANLKWACEKLGIDRLIDRPVRQLSLGERMRGDLAAAMLHSPKILILDEPTIGLDLEGKHTIRDLIRRINKEHGTTVILTTHDLDDVEQLCERLIVINHGKIVEDGKLESLVARLAPHRILIVEFRSMPEKIAHPAAEVLKIEGNHVHFQFEKNRISAAELITDLSSRHAIRDLILKEPDIETMINWVYANKRKPETLVSSGEETQ